KMTKKKESSEQQREHTVAEAEVNPESKIAELTDTLQRLQADFENYKKRVDKEKEQFAKYSSQKLVLSMLPLLDSLELALKNSNSRDIERIHEKTDTEKFRKGIELIYAQFHSILESAGLRPIDALGKKFDPYRHEALIQQNVEDAAKDNIVLEEFQKGYMLFDAVLRHSRVKIGKKQPPQSDRVNAEHAGSDKGQTGIESQSVNESQSGNESKSEKNEGKE
ncbi:nucleotide exchange factor GrpE, partial [Candidatus Parvarchaeota archaeon]|nr:nucleotide exchange factor GrpE [Candidatus Parvarchaeota archaeon]